MIPIFKAVMKYMAPGGFNNVCKKIEVIAKGKQGILMYPDFIFRIQVGKDSSVLPQ